LGSPPLSFHFRCTTGAYGKTTILT